MPPHCLAHAAEWQTAMELLVVAERDGLQMLRADRVSRR
jgi:hypothetical protein